MSLFFVPLLGFACPLSELIIELPLSYPLRTVEVTSNRLGASEAQMRKWQLSMTILLMTQGKLLLSQE